MSGARGPALRSWPVKAVDRGTHDVRPALGEQVAQLVGEGGLAGSVDAIHRDPADLCRSGRLSIARATRCSTAWRRASTPDRLTGRVPHDEWMSDSSCLMCSERTGDAELGRVEVWSDDLWRLTTSIGPGDPTPGFSYLEPRRHIAYITDLDGPEAATFGAVIARCTAALKAATECELVYVYVFGGGIPHLHVHLAPHTAGRRAQRGDPAGRVRGATAAEWRHRLHQQGLPVPACRGASGHRGARTQPPRLTR